MIGFTYHKFSFYLWSPRYWYWRWPEFHCTTCCYFYFWWGPVEIGVAR